MPSEMLCSGKVTVTGIAAMNASWPGRLGGYYESLSSARLSWCSAEQYVRFTNVNSRVQVQGCKCIRIYR